MRSLARRAFTLLEVLIALGILSVSLFVLIDSQATSVIMTIEAEHMVQGTMLCEEKMSQVLLRLESEGFTDSDITEEGDFSNGIFGDFEAGGMDGDFEELNTEEYEDFQWAYTIREVSLDLSGDMASMMGDLTGSGYFGDDTESMEAQQDDQSMGLDDLGVSQDMITDLLSPYIREVRVIVWWGIDDPEEAEERGDIVELVTHVVNPTGTVVPGADQGTQ
jgi:prepilin-type N-terminal cleavage/methylation domain-containing protein